MIKISGTFYNLGNEMQKNYYSKIKNLFLFQNQQTGKFSLRFFDHF